MTQFPSNIQSALLFDTAEPLDLEALVRRFMQAEASSGTQYKLVFDTRPGVFYRLFGTNNVMITVEHMPGPAQLPLFEHTLASAFTRQLTPDARERLARHKSHLLINVHHGPIPPDAISEFQKKINMKPEGHSLDEFKVRLLLCSRLSLLAHQMGHASLVHWTQSGELLRGDMFTKFAAEAIPSLLHIHPFLFDGGKSADGKQQAQIKTVGVAHFLGREIHVLPNPVPWSVAMQAVLYLMAVAMTKNGYVVHDGDTFGPEDESFVCRVRHISEGSPTGSVKGPLYQLELLHSRAHGYSTSDYIQAPVTFDDRNIPPEALKKLGDERQSTVQEWREKRQIAEAAGIQFQVRTDEPRPEDKPAPAASNRWWPFGKRK